jgi:uncharacterized protein (DUF1501 family)
MDSKSLFDRRSFLRKASGLAFGYPAFQTLYDLRLLQNAVAQSADLGLFSDYKALVCLFLSGGNDSDNLVVPNNAEEYALYAANRGAITLSNTPGGVTSNSLLPLNNALMEGRDLGVHSACPELQTLWNENKLSFVANVGTLVEPLTLAQYKGKGRKPLQIGSHNDQVVQWQTSVSDKPSATGWGGRCVDLLKAYSTLGNNRVSLAISASGFNSWEVGKDVSQFQVSSASTGTAGGGAKTLKGFTSNTARAAAIRDIVAQGGLSASYTERDYSGVLASAIDSGDQLNAALNGVSTADHASLNAIFDGTTAAPGVLRSPNGTPDNGNARGLAGQLKAIARIIAARGATGLKRQIFFCQIGGFDTHGGQLAAHNSLYRAVSRNIKAFSDAMAALGISDKVTLFTGSDFGRTYGSNGSGSDHAWGSNQIVVGGAVKGGQIHGKFPELRIGGAHDIGGGRWLPTTSVDQYAATLARWFGVSDGNLNIMLPNLYRFQSRDLGFMS